MSKRQKVTPMFPVSDFEKFMHDEMVKGKTKEQVINEVFNGDGFLIFSESMEERIPKLENAQLFAPNKSSYDIQECRRLRETFGPISDCVDYIKNQILAGGFDVFIDDPTDKHKQEIKKTLLSFMKNVYQDQYTVTLKLLSDIMLDDAIVTGFSAAEMVYQKTVAFEQYAKAEQVVINTKDSSGNSIKSASIQYKMELPKWSDLEGITRLKVLIDPHIKLKAYKNADWTVSYWTYGESAAITSVTQERQMIAKSMGKSVPIGTNVNGTYLHPWQVFALSINRQKPQDIMGRSLILPVMSIAKILEKIMAAVGEGIHRAGNKKYFIVCGTEKRPWSAIHIRNLLQQLKEAGDKGWSTIPVPAGFDIKEAGGQVFEAQNVIDYFLRVISSTMHVPAKVVGVETKDIAEQTNDDLLRYKEAFKTAIETQLFKLAIWTKFGDEQSKQGGSKEPTYLPEIRFRTEELLSEASRLKDCLAILNVANPVRPEVKLEVERDICKIKGYDVLLPSQEEYKKDMEKAEAEMKARLEKKSTIDESTEKQLQTGSTEKFQGPPKPQTEQQQEKRLQAGVNVKKSPKNKSVPE